jgi:hypothetical protein
LSCSCLLILKFVFFPTPCFFSSKLPHVCIHSHPYMLLFISPVCIVSSVYLYSLCRILPCWIVHRRRILSSVIGLHFYLEFLQFSFYCFIVYLNVSSSENQTITSNERMTGERWIGKYMEAAVV